MIKERLLILEDDLVFGELLSRSLKKLNRFEINLCQTLQEARYHIDSIEIQYAIFDLKLHQDSSLKLIPEFKTKHQHAKLLILTGYASIATAVEAIKLGATQYLPKPVEIADILSVFDEQNQISEIAVHSQVEIREQPLSLARIEWEHIQRVLTECNGNISETARILNMHRRTLQRKLNSKNPPK